MEVVVVRVLKVVLVIVEVVAIVVVAAKVIQQWRQYSLQLTTGSFAGCYSGASPKVAHHSGARIECKIEHIMKTVIYFLFGVK